MELQAAVGSGEKVVKGKAECESLASHVDIDGNGLAWHLLLAEHKPVGEPAEPNVASVAIRLASYAAFAQAVGRALATLRRAGLVPLVYLDGRATRLKADVLSSRQQERADRWERLQAAFLDGRGAAAPAHMRVMSTCPPSTPL